MTIDNTKYILSLIRAIVFRSLYVLDYYHNFLFFIFCCNFDYTDYHNFILFGEESYHGSLLQRKIQYKHLFAHLKLPITKNDELQHILYISTTNVLQF